MPFYEKHTVECICIHPIVRSENNSPPSFTFQVLSEITKKGKVKEKNIKCPNCGKLHEVYEIGKSRIVRSGSYRELLDIKKELPEKLVEILDDHGCDCVTYEECELALKKRMKNNRRVILTREYSDGEVFGKFVVIKKNGNFLVETYMYNAEEGVNFA